MKDFLKSDCISKVVFKLWLKNILISKRTDPEFPAGAPWTPQIPGPSHPEPRSIFTSPLSFGPKFKKNMIPSELRVPDFMKFSTASSLTQTSEPWEIDGLSSI